MVPPPPGEAAAVEAVQFSPDHALLAATHTGGATYIYQTRDLVAYLDGARAAVRPLKALPVAAGEAGAQRAQFEWRPGRPGAYDCLLVGADGELSTTVHEREESGVACAAWSPDGRGLAFGQGGQVQVLGEAGEPCFGVKLEGGEGLEWKVDSLRWVGPARILAACMNAAGEDFEAEELCKTFLLQWDRWDAVGRPEGMRVFRFDEDYVNSSISADCPPGLGPCMHACRFKPWDLVLVSHRQSSDCHISLVGFGTYEPAGGGGAVDGPEVLDLLDNGELDYELLQAKVPLTEEDDDNFVLGMALDKTAVATEVKDPAKDRILPPCPVVVLVTADCKLLVYAVAQCVEDEVMNYIYPAEMIMPPNPVIPVPSEDALILAGPPASAPGTPAAPEESAGSVGSAPLAAAAGKALPDDDSDFG